MLVQRKKKQDQQKHGWLDHAFLKVFKFPPLHGLVILF